MKYFMYNTYLIIINSQIYQQHPKLPNVTISFHKQFIPFLFKIQHFVAKQIKYSTLVKKSQNYRIKKLFLYIYPNNNQRHQENLIINYYIKFMTSITNLLHQCPVCGLEKSHLYSISNCSHQFCMECCQSYIKTKCNDFQQIKCMYEGCRKTIYKQTYVYKNLPDNIKNKINRHQKHTFLQKNPHLKSCSAAECQGIVDTKKSNSKGNLICDGKDRHQSCKNCVQLVHVGPCNKDVQKQMNSLNYKKCPKCSVWVQKNEGCEYIGCTCGQAFCYRCGAPFDRDPCRKNKTWQQQQKIRQLLFKFKIKTPISVWQILLLIPKVILIILLTVISGLLYTIRIIISAIFILLVSFLITPFILMGIADLNLKFLPQCLVCIVKIIILILFPIEGLLGIIVALILMIFYPIFRNYYHHGIYDGLEEEISNCSYKYLSVIVFILTCCQ